MRTLKWRQTQEIRQEEGKEGMESKGFLFIELLNCEAASRVMHQQDFQSGGHSLKDFSQKLVCRSSY